MAHGSGQSKHVFYLCVVICLDGTEQGFCMAYRDPEQFCTGNILIPLCVCYSFNLSPFCYILFYSYCTQITFLLEALSEH